MGPKHWNTGYSKKTLANLGRRTTSIVLAFERTVGRLGMENALPGAASPETAGI